MNKWRALLQSLLGMFFIASGVIAIGLMGDKVPLGREGRRLSVKTVKVNREVPATLVSTPWLERASQLGSLQDFLKITSGAHEKQLVAALLEDEFEQGNPFSHLSSHYPLAVLLAKGVKQFHRSTFRTTEFRGEAGYDLIKYEIIHQDGTHSEIMAYLDKDQADDVQSDALAQKANFVLFNVYETSQTSYYNLYRNNELAEHGSLEANTALAMVNRRVNAAVPFMAVSAR